MLDYALRGQVTIALFRERKREGKALLLNEVCKKCSLTKKAVEYYLEQGLIAPSVRENGYRDFSEEDASLLRKISVLRGLGLSVADIRGIFEETDRETLADVFRRQDLRIKILKEKQELILELTKKGDWIETEEKLRGLQNKESVLERLLNAFPGHYGKYLCLHFAPFLNEPAATKEQQSALAEVVSFLDGVSFRLPEDLQKCLDEVASHLDESAADKIFAAVEAVNRDTEKYLADNQEFIEGWMAYKQSEAYKNSSTYRLEEALRQFSSTSGYNEVFIPAMCRLSRSYREYYEAMQRANERFLQKYSSYMQELS